MPAQKSRYGFVDIAKAFGMLAVIWGHINSGVTCTIVYAFDIPLFFFLSGMMYNNRKYNTLVKLLKSRTRTLLLPYVVFSALTWIVWAVYNLILHNNVDFFSPLLQTVIAQGSGGYLVHNVPLWFVTCLFIVEISYYFICKLPDIWNVTVCILCAAIGYWMLNNSVQFDFTKLPWNIESAMSALLFYCFGNLTVKYCTVDKAKKWIYNHQGLTVLGTVLLDVLLVWGSIYNGHVSIGSNLLGKNAILFYLIGIIGTISTLSISIICDFGTSKLANRLLVPIKYIGKNSFFFMAVHVPIKGFLTTIAAKILSSDTHKVSLSLWQSLIVFAGTIVCSWIVVSLINMIKSRIANKDR